MSNPLPQGSTIGILGGGQLGRMLAVAASRLGYKCAIFDPAGDCPASHVANYHHKAAYDDKAALGHFGQAVDLITYEFENIPTAALDLLEEFCPIFPNRTALETAQDRLSEKDFLNGLGLRTAPYQAAHTLDALSAAVATIGTPGILKTRRFGYDGKGQVTLDAHTDISQAWTSLKSVPCVLEGFVDFSCEISVIAARAMDGSIACFDPGQNIHKDGILRTTSVPAALTAAQKTDAVLIASQILNALDYIGVIGVELFVTSDGLLVNEIASRVHNSGHWTQAGCSVDQFEQHIRAIAGLPLGDGSRYADVEMTNLIGDDVLALEKYLNTNHTQVHLYGKHAVKPGRKMGHINRIVSK